MHTDPVCGMTVAPDAAQSVAYEATRYYFCSQGCLRKFRADPSSYLQPASSPVAPGDGNGAAAPAPRSIAADALYTCPMHPEVRHFGPRTCPICGMALEPLVTSLVEEQGELDDMTGRLCIALTLPLPVLLLGRSGMLPAPHLQRWLAPASTDWLQALLATPVVWGAG